MTSTEIRRSAIADWFVNKVTVPRNPEPTGTEKRKASKSKPRKPVK